MKVRSTVRKISVSIPADLNSFIEQYRKDHNVSRSEVISKGLERLREAELAGAYREHAAAWRNGPDKDFWDTAAIDDGLDSDESCW